MILFKPMNDSEINLFWDPQAFLSPAGNRTAWQDNSLDEQRCTLVAVLSVKVSLLIEFVCQKKTNQPMKSFLFTITSLHHTATLK